MTKKMLSLTENERLDDLQCDGLKIVQNKGLYSFTSDSVVLANFLKIKSGERAVEIGSGSGIISILATKKTNAKHILGFEIQKELYLMSQKSLQINNIKNVEFVCDDIKNYKKYIDDGYADVVFSNPPYKKEGSATKNCSQSKAVARHESSLPLENLTLFTSKILKFGGRAYFVYDADRSCEMIFSLIKNGLQPKRMFFTENGKGKVILFVAEAVKGGKSGVKVLPNLVTNDLDGTYIEKIKRGEWSSHDSAKQARHDCAND